MMEEQSKSQLRKLAFKIRLSMTEDQVFEESEEIARRLFNSDIYKFTKRVFSYYSINNEVDTRDINRIILKDKKKLALPVCIDDYNLEFHQIDDLTQVERGVLNIPIPKKKNKIVPQPYDIMLMPGILFSKTGYRIGYGKGYYDRYLSDNKIFKIGLTYDNLLVDDINHSEFDVKADYIITQTRNFFPEEIDD